MKFRNIGKQSILAVLFVALFFSLLQLDYDIKQFRKEKRAEQYLLEDKNSYEYDTLNGIYPDKQEIVDYIYSVYGITVDFDLSYTDMSEKYSIIGENSAERLDSEYPLNLTVSEEDKKQQLEVLVALKETLDQYTSEAIEKLPELIVIRKQPEDPEFTTAGITHFANNGTNAYAALMVLYYYPVSDNYWLYMTSYKETINHEIFHCLDEHNWSEDYEWDSINEDCLNISEYACTNDNEERASVWGYSLAYSQEPNTKKINLLKERYSQYLK